MIGQPGKPVLFGGSQTFATPSKQSAGLSFGSQQPSSGFTFGAGDKGQTGTSSFGMASTQPSTSLFGMSNPSTTLTGNGTSQPQGQGSSSLFGDNKTTLFGGAPSTTTFGTGQPQTTGTSSLFGSAPSAQTSTGLFGAQPKTNPQSSLFGAGTQSTTGAQTTTGTSLFGNNQPSTTTTSSTLFGSAQPATSSTGLFGSTQQTATGGSSLFGSTQPTSLTSGSSLFGQPKPQTSLFGSNPQQTGLFGSNPPQPAAMFGSQPQSTSMIPAQQFTGNLLSAFSSFSGNSNESSKLKEYFINEVHQIIYCFIFSIDESSPLCLFQQLFYNRIPKAPSNVDPASLIYHFQLYNNNFVGEDGKKTHFSEKLHTQGLNNNPNLKKFYGIPIGSPNQLCLRFKTCSLIQLNTIKSIMDLKNEYITLNKRYTVEIQKELVSVQLKKEKIKEKINSIIIKSEKVALILNRADKNYLKENQISQSISNIRRKIIENQIVEKAYYLNNVLDTTSSASRDPEIKKIKNDAAMQSENKSQKYLSCLEELKRIHDSLYQRVKENSLEIAFMKKDLELVKTYGKIK